MLKKLNVLEAVRGGAALYVFLGHLIIMNFIGRGNKIAILFSFGQEAVILFFLMSGFVIQFSYLKKQIPFWAYFKKRFLRIYPLFTISILLVLGYKIISKTPLELNVLLGNLAMLQDVEGLKPYVIVNTYGNLALWSLSYEWWFYMMFIPISRFKNKNTIAITIVVLSALVYFVYPIQIFRWLMYFGIWWSGVILADLYHTNELTIKNVIKKVILQVMLFPTVLLIAKTFKEPFVSVGIHPMLEVRHFASAIVFILAALLWRKMDWLAYAFFKPLEKIAPFSYGLYVLHLPLIMIIEPMILDNVENKLIQFILLVTWVIVLAYWFENKLQRKLNTLFF